jgi:DNA invertase Pin-like site-specific DNA recombinase/uncharacterized protein YdcH (DUF465 family)
MDDETRPMTHNDNFPAGRIAGLIRVSTDKQDNERQKKSFSRFETQHDLKIAPMFEDVGSRDKADKRKQFQLLLDMVRTEMLDWIVVESQDRFGTSGPHEWGEFLSTLRKGGCRLWSIIENRCLSDEDDATVLTTTVNSLASRREQKVKADRDLSKKIVQAKAGEWTGGPVPYGLDVVCKSGKKIKWRVVIEGWSHRLKVWPDGKEERFDGKDNFPAKDRNDKFYLAPSIRTDRLEAVRKIFEWYATETISFNRIAERLKEMKVDPVRAGAWSSGFVSKMLLNPVYIGLPAYNKRSNSRFSEFVEGEYRTAPRKKNGDSINGRQREPDDWVQPDEPVFNPIVPVEVWEKVRTKMNDREIHRKTNRGEAHWLSGLLYCHKCGERMSGDKACEGYICKTYKVNGKKNETGCQCFRVPNAEIEPILECYLEEVGHRLNVLVAADQNSSLVDALFTESWMKECELHYVYMKMTDFITANLAQGIHYIDDSEVIIDQDTMDVYGEIKLKEIYNEAYASNAKMLQEKLAEKEADFDRLFERYKSLKTEMARERADAEMGMVEVEIKKLKGQLEPLVEQYHEVLQESKRLAAAYESALETVQGNENRRKGEVVRQLIDKMICRFDDDSRELIEVEIIPKTGQPWSSQRNYGTA